MAEIKETAQEIADRLASQGDTAAPAEEDLNGSTEFAGNKRKLEDDGDEDELSRKREKSEKLGMKSSATGPIQAGSDWQDTVEVPATLVGKLIGKSGETIRNLQNNTTTRVQIDHNNPVGDYKRVTVTGSHADIVKEATRQIEQIVSDEPLQGDQQKTIDCPQGIVGRIIGRQGETIRSLQQASQANIVVDQNFPEGEDRKVNISGRPDAVTRATKMIEELIAGQPGSAQAIIQKHTAGITRVIECQKSIVGRVIGKGGDTIKTLQRNFGANIQIDQGVDPMKITISGQPGGVEKTAAAVRDIIAGGNPSLGFDGGRLFGGHGGPGFDGPGGFRGGRGPRGPPNAGFGPSGGPPFGGPPFGGFPPYGGGFQGAFPQAGFGGFPGGNFPAAGFQGGFNGGFGGGFGADPYQAQAQAGAAGGYNGSTAAAPAPAASSVWQEIQDDQGRTYYYNTQSGVSQWEKPNE